MNHRVRRARAIASFLCGLLGCASLVAGTRADPLPVDFPLLQITQPGTPAPGRIFLSSFSQSDPSAPSYLMILENDGTPVFTRRLPPRAFDFKLHQDGRLTYWDPTAEAFYALDSTYAVVDSFRCGNGLSTDFHDLVVLPNGHAILMSYDARIMDMSVYDPKGLPDAEVIGLVIQEIDRAKNVVFEWTSWDHFAISDAVGIPLGGRRVDYVHGNSLDVDADGNILLSSRSLNEITKISRATGDVIWRMGGVHNEFQFREGEEFSRQHCARLLQDGRLLLFDNGTFRTPPYSRAVEYEVDEEHRTVREVWEYRHTPDVFGAFSGSVQRLPNGNTLIGWGTTTPTLTEVDPKGAPVYELTFEPGIFSYRAYRFDWPPIEYANVSLAPSILNASIVSGWVTAVIEPVGFDAASIDVATVRLAGSVPANLKGVTLGDANGNGQQDLAVSFSRAALLPLLQPTMTQFEVSGSLVDGRRFHGFAPVRVVTPNGAPRPAPTLYLVSVPGALPVDLRSDVPEADPHGAVAVYDVRGGLVGRWELTSVGAREGVAGFTWNGRRRDGTPAASGIYFARIEGPQGSGKGVRLVIAR